jgi:polygalacturonase
MVEFLDYIVLGDGITMDEEKIQTIVEDCTFFSSGCAIFIGFCKLL